MKQYPNVCAGCGKPAQPNDSLCKSCLDIANSKDLNAPVQGELFVKSTHNPPK